MYYSGFPSPGKRKLLNLKQIRPYVPLVLRMHITWPDGRCSHTVLNRVRVF